MKTRIKTVEYGDGRIVYFAQTKLSFGDRVFDLFIEHPIGFLFFLPISILGSFIASKTVWENMRTVDSCFVLVGEDDLNEHKSMEDAKATINLFLLNKQADLEMKLAEKRSKKVVRKLYLKYP